MAPSSNPRGGVLGWRCTGRGVALCTLHLVPSPHLGQVEEPQVPGEARLRAPADLLLAPRQQPDQGARGALQVAVDIARDRSIILQYIY